MYDCAEALCTMTCIVILRLANFHIASTRKTLRAVNVMTACDLADGQIRSLFFVSKQF